MAIRNILLFKLPACRSDIEIVLTKPPQVERNKSRHSDVLILIANLLQLKDWRERMSTPKDLGNYFSQTEKSVNQAFCIYIVATCKHLITVPSVDRQNQTR
jgi:MFS superfamily sulfate permease-like transporter